MVFTVLAWPIDNPAFLLVLPPERWRVMLEKLTDQSLHDSRVATLERVIGSRSQPLTLDRVGRFCLPENLANLVGIQKEAHFVARPGKFEIWDPKRYAQASAQEASVAAQVAAEINL